MLSGVVRTVFNFKEQVNLFMLVQNIEPLLNGVCGHLVLIRMVFICFANDEAVSRLFVPLPSHMLL